MSVSKSTNSVLSNAGSILRSLDAASNWRALLMTAGAIVAFMLVTAIGAALAAKSGSFIIAGLFSLLAFAFFIAGISASGFMMMDTARGIPARNMTDALFSSVFSIHRLILSLLVIFAIYLVWLVILAVLLFVCKIPGLGPLLYTVVFPVGVIISGIFTIFMLYAGTGVIAPSVWDGGSVMETIARLWAVAKERFMPLIILALLLGLLVGVISGLIFGVFFAGAAVMMGLSASILGSSMGGLGMGPGLLGLMMMGGGYDMEGGGGYMLAALIGGGALACLIAAIPANIFLLGTCINYLQLTEGLDISQAQQQIQAKLDEAKRHAEAAKARAQEMQQQREKQAQEAKTARDLEQAVKQNEQTKTEAALLNPAPLPPAGLTCPSCAAAVSADDVFCEKCGTKLA